MYVSFIRARSSFIEEIFVKPEEKKTVVKIVKKITPTLKERGLTRKDVMQRLKKVNNDEFYTRYEDVAKEIEMYHLRLGKTNAYSVIATMRSAKLVPKRTFRLLRYISLRTLSD